MPPAKFIRDRLGYATVRDYAENGNIARGVSGSANRLMLAIPPDGPTNAMIYKAINKSTGNIDALSRRTKFRLANSPICENCRHAHKKGESIYENQSLFVRVRAGGCCVRRQYRADGLG